MTTINTGNYYGTKLRPTFTKKEIKAVKDTFNVATAAFKTVADPTIKLTLMMEATNPIKNDKTHGRIFRFAAEHYYIELTPMTIERTKTKTEPACMAAIRSFGTNCEVEKQVISCKSVPIETIFAHAVAVVQFLELFANDANL